VQQLRRRKTRKILASEVSISRDPVQRIERSRKP